jgi:hypothetical protein
VVLSIKVTISKEMIMRIAITYCSVEDDLNSLEKWVSLFNIMFLPSLQLLGLKYLIVLRLASVVYLYLVVRQRRSGSDTKAEMKER